MQPDDLLLVLHSALAPQPTLLQQTLPGREVGWTISQVPSSVSEVPSSAFLVQQKSSMHQDKSAIYLDGSTDTVFLEIY